MVFRAKGVAIKLAMNTKDGLFVKPHNAHNGMFKLLFQCFPIWLIFAFIGYLDNTKQWYLFNFGTITTLPRKIDSAYKNYNSPHAACFQYPNCFLRPKLTLKF